MLRLLLAIKPIDIIIIAVLAAAIVGIVAFLVIRKKKGISGKPLRLPEKQAPLW